MRFIASIGLATTLTYADKVCSPDIVKTAASQGFLKSMINCLLDTDPGPEACLSRFVAAAGSPIPDGECRSEYQKLVDQFVTDSISSACQYLTEEDSIPFGCVNGSMLNGLPAFYEATGLFPITLCSVSEVRSRAKDVDYFSLIVSTVIGTNVGIQYGNGACDFCYGPNVIQADLLAFFSKSASNPAVFQGCTDPNGPTDVCMQSTTMINARRRFEACAGHDILFEGPLCSAEQVSIVEAMVPTPFYTIAHCAYNPQTSFCRTIGGYMEAIATATGTECSACYSEFKDEVAALADTDTGCTGNVFSDDCLMYLSEALIHFESCSGHTIKTSGPN